MATIAFVFPLAAGLHARPASLLRDASRPFAARVVFHNLRRRRRADAASVLELVASATVQGDPCRLEISGPGQQEAAAALRAFVERELPRADDGTPPPPQASGQEAWLPPGLAADRGLRHSGQALAPGVGRGRLQAARGGRRLPRRFACGRREPAAEKRRFAEACDQAAAELDELARAAAGLPAAILRAQAAILADPGFAGRIARLIAKEGLSAGAAIEKTAARHAAVLRRAPSAYLRERAADLRAVSVLLAEKLYGRLRPALAAPGRGPVVLAAPWLTPAELLQLDRRRVRGLVLGETGPTSHVAILARSLAIPAVSLPAARLASLPPGCAAIVDGGRGLVLANPGPAWRRILALEEDHRRRLAGRRARLAAREGRTRDDARVEVAANIGSTAELAAAWRQGAEGIGLFRSEFLFLDRDAPPGEQEQFRAYARAARSARGRPVILRTLDVGGDKPLPYLPLARGENPFLGRRAVRFYGEHAGLIGCQLRAALRAARFGHLKLMVPMVASADEVRLVRRLLAEAAAELRRRRIAHSDRVELGIMVETPAAALALDLLAVEADFFSVGSNDLLQYAMAADRGDRSLAALHDPLQPAFLRLLRQAACLARRSGRWLGLCGEMAGRAELLPLLVGIGFAELSMAPARIPAVKERLAQLERGECRSLLAAALRCPDAGGVAALLAGFHSRQAARLPVCGPDLIRLGSPCRSATEAVRELCLLLELSGRTGDAGAIEQAVWRREETCATDLGLGFALPHAKSPAARAASVAFLRPRRPFRWGAAKSPVRGVLLIAVPENGGQEHLRLIARLARRLMDEEFRAALLGARDEAAALAALSAGLNSD